MTTSEMHDDRRGELVTVADLPLEFVHQEGPWVEVVPENGDCDFTVHESQVCP